MQGTRSDGVNNQLPLFYFSLSIDESIFFAFMHAYSFTECDNFL